MVTCSTSYSGEPKNVVTVSEQLRRHAQHHDIFGLGHHHAFQPKIDICTVGVGNACMAWSGAKMPRLTR